MRAGLDARIGFSGKIAVVIVGVRRRIAKFAAAVIVSAIGPVKGEDVVAHLVPRAAHAEVEDPSVVAGADVVMHLVVAASEDDAPLFVVKAYVTNDHLALWFWIGMDGIAGIVKDDVAVCFCFIGVEVNAVIAAFGAVIEDDVASGDDPHVRVVHLFQAAVDVSINDVVGRAAAWSGLVPGDAV